MDKIIYRGYEIIADRETGFPMNEEPFEGFQGFCRRIADGQGKSCGTIWKQEKDAILDAKSEVDLLIDDPAYASMYGF